MSILYVALMSVFSLAALFLLTKLIGNRQLSQMSLFDYVTGITIGSIAAEMATSLEGDFLKPLTAMIIYGVITALTSVLTCKSLFMRKILGGTPVLLYESGKLYEKNLGAAKLDINEFLTQCRVAGYFDLSQLEAAVLETNGQISFLPLSENRPLTPADMQLKPDAEKPVANVIIDGKIMTENLKHCGKGEEWLNKKLQENGVKNASEVFLATCDVQDKLCVYKRIGKRIRKDIFE